MTLGEGFPMQYPRNATRAFHFTWLALLSACTGEDGKSSLTRNAAEPPGENCPAGGVEIQSGIDSDSDGKLSSNEVTTRSFVCRPVATPAPLVNTTTLAAGNAVCPMGGVRVDVGLDLNGNGVLDANEGTKSATVCAGASGA